jgi:hypothetical protein
MPVVPLPHQAGIFVGGKTGVLVEFETEETLPTMFEGKVCPHCGNNFRLYDRATHAYFCICRENRVHQLGILAIQELRVRDWLNKELWTEIHGLREDVRLLTDIVLKRGKKPRSATS